MRKIDKSIGAILSVKYKAWVDKFDAAGKVHPGTTAYYDDIAMNLYKCQSGVCAYTEAFICPPELYEGGNWTDGKYELQKGIQFNRKGHSGEIDHFNPEDKKLRRWNWDNLFMVAAKVNGIKSNKEPVSYLKPDLPDYSPEKYFEFDKDTNMFIPNTKITQLDAVEEIQYMIDEVLLLNHGVVFVDRGNYIKEIENKKTRGEEFTIDRFFTAVKFALGIEV